MADLDRRKTGRPAKLDGLDTANSGGGRPDETRLLAALSGLTGRVIGGCRGRRRYQEFRKFLRQLEQLDRGFPGGLGLHVVLDDRGRTTARRFAGGWPGTRASGCTSRPMGPRGRSSSRAGSAGCGTFVVTHSAARGNRRRVLSPVSGDARGHREYRNQRRR